MTAFTCMSENGSVEHFIWYDLSNLSHYQIINYILQQFELLFSLLDVKKEPKSVISNKIALMIAAAY